MSVISEARSLKRRYGRKVKRLFEINPKLKFYFGWHYKHSTVNDKRILFESFHGKTVSDSPLYMLKEFSRRPEAKEFEIFYATADKPAHEKLIAALNLPVKVQLVDIASRKYPEVLATAKYLVNNSSFPAYFMRKADQEYVQTWHGTPLKTLGKRMRLGIESMYNVQHNFLHASIVTFPNDFTRDCMMRDYNLEDLFTGKVAMVGYPRNQVFLDKNAPTKSDYGLDGIRTYAYMPTWRGTSNHDISTKKYAERVEAIFEKIDAALADDQRLFVNFHPIVAADVKLGDYKHIVPFPDDVDNYEFLGAMDALITDYSSVFFDYSLTRKPVILFAYDLEEYLEDRGVYLDIESLPFKLIFDDDEMASYLAAGDFSDALYSGTDYEQSFLQYDRADNAARVLDLLFTGSAEGVALTDYAKNAQKEWTLVESRPQKKVSDVARICDFVNPETDIALFLKSPFKKAMSEYLHDFYRDDFNFIFITDTTPRTFLEDITKRFSGKTQKALAEREAQRRLPGLNFTTKPVLLYETVDEKAFVTEVVEGKNDSVSVNDGVLTVRLHGELPKGCVLKTFAIMSGRKVLWERALSPEEAREGYAKDDFSGVQGLNLDLKKFKRLAVVFRGENADTGELVLRTVANTSESGKVAPDVLGTYRMPLVVDEAQAVSEEAMRNDGTSVEMVPYLTQGGRRLFLLVTYLGESLQHRVASKLVSCKPRDNQPIALRMKLKKGNYKVTGVRLKYRSVIDELSYALDFSVRETSGCLIVDAAVDPARCPMKDIYWDIYVLVDQYGIEQALRVKMGRARKFSLSIINSQSRVGENNLVFPYSTIGGNLAFVFREYSEADSNKMRRRELATFFVFAILHPYWKRKRVWLVYEKFCSLAQDNAYYFFKYCMENLPESERKHIFYIIDKDAPDAAKLKDYQNQVIDRFSFKHFLYAMVAKIYIASDSKSHVFVWRPKPSLVNGRIRKHKILFLQHGVTALKQVASIFGKKGSSPMTYFLTTSQNEQDIVAENFGYRRRNAPILGFSRWDVLEDKSTAENPSILLMPTWRPWLEEQSDEVFCASEYYERYSSLIASPALLDFLERENVDLNFFIHPKLAEKISAFASVSDRINLIGQGTVALNELMMRSSMLITDYSSVCWDMLYMDKPVSFYQFDQELYEETVGSYINLETDLPGDLCKTEDQLVASLESICKNGFAISDEYKKKADAWFEYKDDKNRERTYEFLIERGY